MKVCLEYQHITVWCLLACHLGPEITSCPRCLSFYSKTFQKHKYFILLHKASTLQHMGGQWCLESHSYWSWDLLEWFWEGVLFVCAGDFRGWLHLVTILENLWCHQGAQWHLQSGAVATNTIELLNIGWQFSKTRTILLKGKLWLLLVNLGLWFSNLVHIDRGSLSPG